MPSRVPLARNAALSIPTRRSALNSYVCPSCSTWRDTTRTTRLPVASTYPRLSRALHDLSRPTRPSILKNIQSPRYATTLISRTAINSPSTVPDVNRDLYVALERLKDVASDYVNQSRLQLALRGLEAEVPTIRIGLLGLGRDGNLTARQLLRVLLADALSDEAAWERVLTSGSGGDGKALLIRYGAEDDIPPLNPLVETLSVPSRVLQKHSLEFLITGLNTGASAQSSDPAGLVEAMLVPPLQTPVAFTGRAGFVRYPVHKAIVVGEGIEGCMDFGRLAATVESTVLGLSGAKERLIQVALSIPRDSKRGVRQHAESDLVSAVDIDQAEAALELFRQDVANGPLFNVKWKASNVEAIKNSLTSDHAAVAANASPSALRPALEHHIRSTLDSATAAITAAEIVAHSTQQANTIPEGTRANIQAAITNWSQHAHTDLQISLATALASRSWRRTSWSRLLWRVDDVGVAAEGVLRNFWLLDAEAGLAFLAGRVEQAGFLRSGGSFNPDYALHRSDRALNKAGEVIGSERAYLSAPTAPASQARTGLARFFSKKVRAPTVAELLKTDVLVEKVAEEGGINILHTRPWPLSIHFTRQKLLHTLVPALQRRAQSLLVQALTTIGGTSALGAWIYVATAGVSVAEAGAVAALGLVWSCRRLQKKWEEERRIWEDDVRESGRVVLAEVEEGLRGVVRANERPGLRAEDVDSWMKAREIVNEVGEALSKRQQ